MARSSPLPDSPRAAGPSRLHVVLVPGFGGFDALGQIEYYPGTTEVARRWREAHPERQALVVHYFDNLPTAGVATRAVRLKRYLLKRRARNELALGDRIALVGHSTGGLDIRALLRELHALSHAAARHLPDAREQADVDAQREAAELLEMIDRVVFLSVPQRGTNMADWVRSQQRARKRLVQALRVFVWFAHTEPVQDAGQLYARVRRRLPRGVERVLDARVPDLFAALSDVITEVSQSTSNDPVLAADGREALADLQLWLAHTHGDFLAIDDLAVLPQERSLLDLTAKLPGFLVEPRRRANQRDVTHLARANREQRAEELAIWRHYGIEVMSFATRARPPFGRMRDSARLLTLRAWLAALGRPFFGETDFLFRLVYTACSSGPFVKARRRIEPGEPDHGAGARDFVTKRPVPAAQIESWHNDGVVNTASMLWPNGSDTWLVDADHGDIIGHYRQWQLHGAERKFRSYDILGSESRVDDALFEQVWFAVFDHCARVASSD